MIVQMVSLNKLDWPNPGKAHNIPNGKGQYSWPPLR